MADTTQTVVAKTSPDGRTLLVQVTAVDGAGGGEELVRAGIPDLRNFMATVTALATDLQQAIAAVKPKRASVEFGLNIAMQSGVMTAFLVDASGEASVRVTLEWGD
ncbi:CU044_2847 family protein [Kitasatospora sp. NPDC004240]